MISIVCYLWRGTDPRRVYLPEHVNTLARSIRRTLSLPHRFICVSDEGDGFDSGVEWVQTPEAARKLGEISTLEGRRFPSCYRRLWNFSKEARAILGERILALDIDLVAVRDFANLCARDENFVGWRPRMQWGSPDRVGGGIYLLRAGTHTDVYERFAEDPWRSQQLARDAGYRGSDQAWISYCVGKRAAVWPDDAGIYSIRDLRDGRLPLPADARLVQFNGPRKPWDSDLAWVREHWN